MPKGVYAFSCPHCGERIDFVYNFGEDGKEPYWAAFKPVRDGEKRYRVSAAIEGVSGDVSERDE